MEQNASTVWVCRIRLLQRNLREEVVGSEGGGIVVADHRRVESNVNLSRFERFEEAAVRPPDRCAFVISAHGGSGATTICRWLGGNIAQDWGMAVPPSFGGSTAVVTCLATPHGLARAGELVRYLRTSTDCGLVLLVVTGDGRGPEPVTAKSRLRVLSAYVEDVIRLPFVQRWRFMDDPLSEPAPQSYSNKLHQLRQLLQPVESFAS